VVDCWAESLANQQRIAGDPDRRTEIRDPAKRAPLTKEKRPTKPERKREGKKNTKTNKEKKRKWGKSKGKGKDTSLYV
jgi:hypothetical protein